MFNSRPKLQIWAKYVKKVDEQEMYKYRKLQNIQQKICKNLKMK